MQPECRTCHGEKGYFSLKPNAILNGNRGLTTSLYLPRPEGSEQLRGFPPEILANVLRHLGRVRQSRLEQLLGLQRRPVDGELEEGMWSRSRNSTVNVSVSPSSGLADRVTRNSKSHIGNIVRQERNMQMQIEVKCRVKASEFAVFAMDSRGS